MLVETDSPEIRRLLRLKSRLVSDTIGHFFELSFYLDVLNRRIWAFAVPLS